MEGFTLEEVEELLPETSVLLEEAVAVHEELQTAYEKAIPVDSENIDEKVLTNDIPEKDKKRIKVLTEELNDILEELEELGAIVRDLELGTVDFPSSFQGRDIYFCWRIGEEKVDYWHDSDCTFADRNKILRLGE